jgi:hypothetical protein
VAFQIVRPGDLPTPLFALPVHLQEFQLQPADASLGQCVTLGNRPGFFAQRTGAGALRFTYRVAVENRDGKKRAQIPLLLGASGNVTLESPRKDLEILTASLWSKELLEKSAVHQIGVAGEDFLGIEWRELDGGAAVDAKRQADGNLDFYGIGLTRAQNLTVINSDGSCTHFAEFELPAFRKDEFRLRLPADARLISVSVNGNEISSPPVEDRICRVRLPDRQPQPSAHQLSFRFAYPPAQLGFIGSLELSLPEVFQTTGTLEWVVAFPNGFDTQVISSGLEAQKAPLDLNRFGDYGRILKSHPQTCLAKDLAPPGVVTLNLKYRQLLPGINERTAD